MTNSKMSLVEQIRAEFRREHERRKIPRTRDDLPIAYEDITVEWLTDILVGDQAGVKVVSFRLGPPDDGTFNRRRIFLEYSDSNAGSGLPRSVFCKAAHSLSSRLLMGSSGSIKTEALFYTRIRPELAIEAPRALFAHYDPRSFNSMLVLEDIGDQVIFCSHRTKINRAKAQAQMRILAYVHGRFYERRRFDAIAAELPTFQMKFQQLQKFGLEECCANGFLAAEAVIPVELFRRSAEIWPATLRAVSNADRLPKTINHADVHLANWYVRQGDVMGLTDWSALCVNHWSRDFAYVVSTSLEVEDRRAWEVELLHFYLEELKRCGGPDMDFSEAWTCYRRQLMAALAYWTITLTPAPDMPDMQPRDLTLEFIRRITTAMDDLDALSAG